MLLATLKTPIKLGYFVVSSCGISVFIVVGNAAISSSVNSLVYISPVAASITVANGFVVMS